MPGSRPLRRCACRLSVSPAAPARLGARSRSKTKATAKHAACGPLSRRRSLVTFTLADHVTPGLSSLLAARCARQARPCVLKQVEKHLEAMAAYATRAPLTLRIPWKAQGQGQAVVAELVDAPDSGSGGRKLVVVRLSPTALILMGTLEGFPTPALWLRPAKPASADAGISWAFFLSGDRRGAWSGATNVRGEHLREMRR